LPVSVDPSVIRESLVLAEGRRVSESVLSMYERTMIAFSGTPADGLKPELNADPVRTPHPWSIPAEFQNNASAMSMIDSGHHSPLPRRAYDSDVAYRSDSAAQRKVPPTPRPVVITRGAGILGVHAPSVRLLVVDASSGRPLGSSEVTVHSDNGIRCTQPPCGTMSAEWKGRTDTAGYVDVPTRTFQAVTDIKASGHEMVLIDEAERLPDGTWTIELVADEVFDPPGESMRADHWPGYRPVKLIDGSSGRPIANTAVHVVSGRTVSFDLKTNGLGYLLLPNDKVQRLGDLEKTWVTVAGFRRAKIGVGETQRRAILRRL
jgi:hypothetical protein